MLAVLQSQCRYLGRIFETPGAFYLWYLWHCGFLPQPRQLDTHRIKSKLTIHPSRSFRDIKHRLDAYKWRTFKFPKLCGHMLKLSLRFFDEE